MLVSEIRKNKRSKALAISALLIVVYEAITVFYTVRAVGLFDDFMYLYKFALSYMDFLILPMILLSFITAIFSTDYKSDTIKYLWTIPVSKKRFFFAKAVYVLLLACMFMI
ncbi:MAG: ABC transporter permease, partial [Treponema sp.]|uniref:ABC transporter permease n=1 Tax=Treponema sp. TaxID=166 RepID=UPI003FA313F9